MHILTTDPELKHVREEKGRGRLHTDEDLLGLKPFQQKIYFFPTGAQESVHISLPLLSNIKFTLGKRGTFVLYA